MIDPRRCAPLLGLALLTACNAGKPPSTQAPPGAEQQASAAEPPAPAGEPQCFFNGDVTSAVRLTSTPTASSLDLAVTWDTTPPPGATWVPVGKLTSVEMPFGVECRAPFDVMADTGVTASVTGDRSIRVEIPRSTLDTLGRRCSSRKLRIPLTLNGTYAAPCKHAEGDGLPFHNLTVDLTIPANGRPLLEQVHGSTVLEG